MDIKRIYKKYIMMISKIKRDIRTFLADKNKKIATKIISEFFTLWRVQKEFPMHYFSRFLYRKDFINYKDFIPTRKYFKLISSDKIQNDFFVTILTNKLLFALFCEKYNIAAPKMTSFNSGFEFFLAGNKFTISSNTELILFFKEFFDKSNFQKIFIKRLDTKGGTGIFLLEKEFHEEQINSFGHLILSGSYIHQECVLQHQEINKIYENSINTLRFDICIDNNKNRHLLGAVMRFGMGGSVIDNRSKGGFFVSIDDNTGCLLKRGYKQMGFGGAELIKHPNTNFVFEGYKIPYYDQAKQLAMDMSTIIPNRLVGWDIAITPDGPLVIEGNHDSNITMSEVAYGGYLKHPIIREMIASM